MEQPIKGSLWPGVKGGDRPTHFLQDFGTNNTAVQDFKDEQCVIEYMYWRDPTQRKQGHLWGSSSYRTGVLGSEIG